MNEGVYVMGTCVGFVSEPWARNGRSGTNYRLGIARSYVDKWGNRQTEVMQIDCAADGAEKIAKQAARLKGEAVAIRVVPLAKVGGRSGAFSTLFAPKESDLVPQSGLIDRAPVAPIAQAK